GYALLGASWLIWKTEGPAQAHARRFAYWLGSATLVALVAVSAATPFLSYDYWRRWFSLPGVLVAAQVPLLVVIAATAFFFSLRLASHSPPFPISLSPSILPSSS